MFFMPAARQRLARQDKRLLYQDPQNLWTAAIVRSAPPHCHLASGSREANGASQFSPACTRMRS